MRLYSLAFAIFFFYFGALGVLLPYWAVYLQSQGFNLVEVGYLVGVLMGTKLIAPNLWGYLADKSGYERPLLLWAAGLTWLFLLPLFHQAWSFWQLLIITFAFSFFWHASLPQFEAVLLNLLGGKSARYAWLRIGGSLGFMAMVSLTGRLMEEHQHWLIILALFCFVSLHLSLMAFPLVQKKSHTAADVGFFQQLQQPEVWAFFVVATFMQLSHASFYSFFTLQLQALDYSAQSLSFLWSFGVVMEILAFALAPWILPRIALKPLLGLLLLLAALRWQLHAHLADSLRWMFIAQSLHAATFALFHAAAMQWIHREFTGRTQVRGQALYASLTHGGGIALGAVIAGYCWSAGGAVWAYGFSSLMALTALLILWWKFRLGQNQ